jgi:hypothetical protein
MLPAPIMPNPPALLTADASFQPLAQIMPAWIMGYWMLKRWVIRLVVDSPWSIVDSYIEAKLWMYSGLWTVDNGLLLTQNQSLYCRQYSSCG